MKSAIHERARTRIFLTVVMCVATALCGCSSDQSIGWGQMVEATRMAFSNHSSVTLQEAAAIPYATLGVRIGDGPQQIVISASDVPSQRLWTSAGRIALITDHGRITRTSGLGRDLNGLQFESKIEAPITTRPKAVKWVADFWDIGIYAVPVSCEDTPTAIEKITILGSSIETERIDETCFCPQLNWNFVNTYWVDSSGNVWKSIQYIRPDFAPLEIEVLRPSAS